MYSDKILPGSFFQGLSPTILINHQVTKTLRKVYCEKKYFVSLCLSGLNIICILRHSLQRGWKGVIK